MRILTGQNRINAMILATFAIVAFVSPSLGLPYFRKELYSRELSTLVCDPAVLSGVIHCGGSDDIANTLLIDPSDPHVQFRTAMPVNRKGEECNSVNHWNKDSDSNCPEPYPFESVEDMLKRYKDVGGAGIINTDYFGPDGDHGAQGLAIRNGDRLDGKDHGVTSIWALRAPALGISPEKQFTFLVPESQEYISQNLSSLLFNTVGGGPMLVENGTAIQRPCQGFIGKDTCSRVGQSAAGVTADGKLVFITARMDAETLAEYMVNNYQVVTAIKFDGGGSSSLAWVDNQGEVRGYRGTPEKRAVAQGLLVLSQPLEVPVMPTVISAESTPQDTPFVATRQVSPTKSIPTDETKQSPSFWDSLRNWWIRSDADNGIDGFGIGSSAHLRLGSMGIAEAYNQQQQLGLHWTREEIPWSEIEAERPGQFRWKYDNRDFGKMLQAAKDHNINVIALLSYGPNPTLSYGDTTNLLDRWKSYVQAVVDKYGDQIDYWEIENEMNSRFFWGKVIAPGTDQLIDPDPHLYSQMLSIAYDIIKKEDQNDVVILGGLVTVTDGDCATNPFVYLGEIYQAGVWNKFDAIGFHPYWGSPPENPIDRGMDHDPRTGACLDTKRTSTLLREVQSLEDLTNQFGSKPIWITEIGWDDQQLKVWADYRGTQPDLVESDYLIRTYVPLISEKGVAKVIWYTQVGDKQNEDFVLGTPGQRALGNIAKLITGSQPLGQFQGQTDQSRMEDDDVYEYRFAKGNTLIIVTWKARGGDKSREIFINNISGTQVRKYQPDVDEITDDSGEVVQLQDGQVVLNLTERPVILIAAKPGWSENLIQQMQQGINNWWKVQQNRFSDWWKEQMKNLKDKAQKWWEDQREHFMTWMEEQLQKLSDEMVKQLKEMLTQCLGSTFVPTGLVVLAWAKRGKRRRIY